MKSLKLLLVTASTLLLAPSLLPAADHGAHQVADAKPGKADQKFLANYEGVRAALAADDLATAKKFAANISEPAARDIANARSLKDARTAFKTLSAAAIQMAKGREGYYVATCPMAKADWLQTSKAISNPYYGKSMLTCGSIKN